MTDGTNLEAAAQYLVSLYGDQPQGLIWIGGHADGFRGKTFTSADAAARYAIELDNRGGIGVYHRSTTLAHVPEKRGDASDSHSVFYFALDGDLKGPGHKATDLPETREDLHNLIKEAGFPRPSVWVHSGGGYYPQWRFAEPIDVCGQEERTWAAEAFAAISEHFIATAAGLGWKLDNVRDLARIFRMPGTTNRKAEPVIAWAGADSGERFDLGVLASLARRATRPVRAAKTQVTPASNDDLFDDAKDERRFTEAQALDFLTKERRKLAGTTSGFNNAINAFAMACAHFPWLVDRERCARNMISALKLVTGWEAPDAQDIATIESAYSATEAGKSWVAVKVEASDHSDEENASDPRLRITSPADMAYWLQGNAGTGRTAGLFLRNGAMVHTPRIGEAGYIPAPDGGDNGTAEIRPLSAPVLAAKLQYLYECFKIVPIKDEKGKVTGTEEVAALFPVEAARRATDAPEAMAGLRPLTGITSTPMVRANGSLILEPGYDTASGYLFLPDPGLGDVKVPEMPDAGQVERARELLLEMVGDFPFATVNDRANYLGLLFTPLLRQVAPPSYKLFGIGAHQPGSGKSLLAEIAGILHGSVLRSETPEDEAEWRKQTTSILATTSAPLVVLDNIMGVLKSSVLAGLLTAGREITDRELGSSRTITVANDRVWVVTGNNLSLGGDMVRRTITVLIDPDTPDPQARTDFRIPDLRTWVIEHRAEVLAALLTLVRAWVVAGMPEAARKQSDSFARWQRVVAGVLQVAGIEGVFDADSGRRAATGGDDDGLFRLLDVLRERFGDRLWTTAEALEPKAEDGTFLIESRDWLPMIVLDRLARSEAAGRNSFGRWLDNRVGRWVSDEGRALVVRRAGKDKRGMQWRVEER